MSHLNFRVKNSLECVDTILINFKREKYKKNWIEIVCMIFGMKIQMRHFWVIFWDTDWTEKCITYSFSSSIDDRVSLDFSSVSLFFSTSAKLPVDWDNVKVVVTELFDFSSNKVSKLRRIQLGVVDSSWSLEDEVGLELSVKE